MMPARTGVVATTANPWRAPRLLGPLRCGPFHTARTMASTAAPLTAVDDDRLLLERELIVGRWVAVFIGILSSLPAAERADRTIAFASSIVMFAATWRTLRPLGRVAPRARLVQLGVEVVAVAGAVGSSGSWKSPFTSSLIVLAAAVGLSTGLAAAAVAVGGIFAGVAGAAAARGFAFGDRGTATSVMAPVVLAGLGTGIIAVRFRRVEERRSLTERETRRLGAANSLMVQLTQLTRAGGVVRDVNSIAREAIERLAPLFQPDNATVLMRQDAGEDWLVVAELDVAPDAVGAASTEPLASVFPTSGLPGPVSDAVTHSGLLHIVRLTATGMHPGSTSALIGPLVVRDEVIGAVVLERGGTRPYDAESVRDLGRTLDVIGLNLDNSRWFRRLRLLGAEDERARVARDIHDRLGSAVAYLAFGLERLRARHSGDEDLATLHDEARSTVAELRDTLWQLRTGITSTQAFEDVVAELVERFEARTEVAAAFIVENPGVRWPPMIELELLRITQEALNNIERHAKAESVSVRWGATAGTATLIVSDDGRGFDMTRSARSDSYGLAGMRERADAIGAILDVRSEPERGTTVRVVVHASGVNAGIVVRGSDGLPTSLANGPAA